MWGLSIYSALDTNEGTTAWVFESGYQDSVLLIQDNRVVSNLGNVSPSQPTGIAFDSKNNLTYITYGIPSDCIQCPYGVSAISGNQIVSSNLSLTGWPAGIAYDPQFNYLYISYIAIGINSEQGIGVIDPSSGNQVAFVSSGDNSNAASFAYNPGNGEMFVAVPHSGGDTTVFVFSGSQVASRFQVMGGVSSLVVNQNDSNLYLSRGNEILIVDSSNGNTLGTIQASGPEVMVYDTADQFVCAFGAGKLTIISGTTVKSQSTISYNVTSALYDSQFNNILAFF
jgi:DNA-binding beta-propeller fold protein YncE